VQILKTLSIWSTVERKTELKRLIMGGRGTELEELRKEKLEVQELRLKVCEEILQVKKERLLLLKDKSKILEKEEELRKEKLDLQQLRLKSHEELLKVKKERLLLFKDQLKVKLNNLQHNYAKKLGNSKIKRARNGTERRRQYRERIRNNPEKHLQSRLKEKVRSAKRRKEGKIKTISRMIKQEKRVQRKKWREIKEKQRKIQIYNQTNLNLPLLSPYSRDPPFEISAPSNSSLEVNEEKAQILLKVKSESDEQLNPPSTDQSFKISASVNSSLDVDEENGEVFLMIKSESDEQTIDC